MKGKKLVSIGTGLFFLFSQFSLPAEVFGASQLPISQAGASVPFQLHFPPELGTIQTLIAGEGPAIVHIQTAHGNYEAQTKIREILHYLEEKHGFNLLLLEGHTVELEPDRVRFFPEDMSLTLKIAEDLTEEALLKGENLFLLESEDARAYGIEDRHAYAENGLAFLKVLAERGTTEDFLRDMDQQIERLASPYLNSPLRSFLKTLELYEAQTLPFMDWLSYLNNAAAEHLGFDIASPRRQLDWPMLFRIFKLKEFEYGPNMAVFPKERGEFLKLLRQVPEDIYTQVENLLSSPLSQHPLPDPETGLLFERMVSHLPPTFSYEAFPNIAGFIGHLILQSELKGDLLMSEMTRLSDEISEALAPSEEAKKVLALLADYRLLKRLFALQLTPEDHEKLLSRGENVRPEALLERFSNLNETPRIQNVRFSHVEEIGGLFDSALEFYRWVKERDGRMLENIETRIQELKAEKVVVITGGFHAGPFKEHFRKAGYNYALVAPKITTAGGHETYIKAAFELGRNSLKRSTWQLTDPMNPEFTPAAGLVSRIAFHIVRRTGEQGPPFPKGPVEVLPEEGGYVQVSNLFGYRVAVPVREGEKVVVTRTERPIFIPDAQRRSQISAMAEQGPGEELTGASGREVRIARSEMRSDWPEAAYYLQRIQSEHTESQDKMNNIDALVEGFKERPETSERDRITDVLLRQYRSLELEKDEKLRGWMMRGLVVAGIGREDVQAEFLELLENYRSKPYAQVGLAVQTFLMVFRSPVLLRGSRLDPADFFYKIEPALLPLLSHGGDPRLGLQVMSILNEAMGFSEPFSFLKRTWLENGPAADWKPALRALMTGHKERRTRLSAAATLLKLGGEVSEEFSALFSEVEVSSSGQPRFLSAGLDDGGGLEALSNEVEQMQQRVEDIKLRDRLEEEARREEVIAALDPGQLVQLRAQITEARSPAKFLYDLFESGKRVVFFNKISSIHSERSRASSLLAIFKELRRIIKRDTSWESRPTHLALPIPSDKGELFERFLTGDASDGAAVQLVIEAFDIEMMSLREQLLISQLRKVLNDLRGGLNVSFIYYAAPANLQGELAYEHQFQQLSRIYESKNQSRILVYGHIVERKRVANSPLIASGRKLLSRYGTREFTSLGAMGVEAWGSHRAASVLEQTSTDLIVNSRIWNLHNLDDLITDSRIRTSKALRPQETHLADLRFDPGMSTSYGEAWDGVFLRFSREDGREDDDDDDRDFQDPEGPSGLAAQPFSEADAPAVYAGARSEMRNVQQAFPEMESRGFLLTFEGPRNQEVLPLRWLDQPREVLIAGGELLKLPLARTALSPAEAREAQKAVGIPLEIYLEVLKQAGAVEIEAVRGNFAYVADISEWTPEKAELLYRQLGSGAHLVLTDTVSAASSQEARALERNSRFLKQRFGGDRVHSAGNDALQAVVRLQRNGSIQGSVAAFSEDVNTGFAGRAFDFSEQVNGTTLRFKNQELQEAGIRIDLSTYAIPLVKLLGEATKEQADTILALFNLKRDGHGEVSVGINFVTAISNLYAQYRSELSTAVSA